MNIKHDEFSNDNNEKVIYFRDILDVYLPTIKMN